MKYPDGTEVYLLPILDRTRTHFSQDIISVTEGTYRSIYGGTEPRHDQQYSLKCGSWYPEHTLVPTNGRTLEQCREEIIPEIFAVDYKTMLKVMWHLRKTDPWVKMFKEHRTLK